MAAFSSATVKLQNPMPPDHATMRAAIYHRAGPAADVLTLETRDVPAPGANEVTVRLHASSVNIADTLKRQGKAGHPMEGSPICPNSDGAGIVVAVGSDALAPMRQKRVWLYNGQRGGRLSGTAAEYIALDADLVSVLPDRCSFEEGACLGIPCMTAYISLFRSGSAAGRNVLVTGGAGAVGHYAVQLAKWSGAKTVIATVRGAEKAELAKHAGADIVIDTATGDLAELFSAALGSEVIDRVVDVDFASHISVLPPFLAQGAVVSSYASASQPVPAIPFYALMRKNVRIETTALHSAPIELRHEAQREITRWVGETGGIHRISNRFALSDIVAAHECVEAGGKSGTVIVTIE